MAGIWLSVLIGGLLILFTVVALTGSVAKRTVDVKSHSVLKLELSGAIGDRATEQSLMEVIQTDFEQALSLSEIVSAIRKAESDERIEGIVLDMSGLSVGLAQCEELMDAINEFKTSGKWVWAYSDSYSQADYFIATAADKIYLNPIGMVDIHGLSAKVLYFKELLDKVGVNVQVVKVGTYKSAVEPFLLNGMSDANREQIDHFLGRMWDQVTAVMAKSRSVTVDTVNVWADSFAFAMSPSRYVDDKIVDKLVYRREFDEMVAKQTGEEEPAYVSLADYKSGFSFGGNKKADKKVAVLYALGDITESADEGIASDRLVPQILKLADDETIDGLVLRVNSGGGSAFASEQIWDALQQYKKKTGNPFYVSMGDMAASGGYYISCGADKIYASPLTLTGSIGIFGIIPDVQPLMKEKLGVNMATVATNTGSFPDILQPMTEQQRGAMQSYVDRGYDLFVSRCAAGRKMTKEEICKIAEGRVWDGLSALENGLVDELGGLRSTLNGIAGALGTDYESLEIVEYPEQSDKWWMALSALNSEAAARIMSGVVDRQSMIYATIARRVRNLDPLQCRMNSMIIK